jgi:hypothetical protein
MNMIIPLPLSDIERPENGMATSPTDFEYYRSAAGADRFGRTSYDALLLFGRVFMALIFVQSGFGKLLDIGAFTASLGSKGVPLASVFGVVGPCVEFFGGLAVLLGLQTRYAAALIASGSCCCPAV